MTSTNHIIAILSPLSLHFKFHMSNLEPDINVWEEHEYDKRLWKDAEESEARKKMGYISWWKGNLLQNT